MSVAVPCMALQAMLFGLLGPYGIKGVGEGALAAVPAAIANALADLGLHMTEMPFTPERVWRALQESGGEDH